MDLFSETGAIKAPVSKFTRSMKLYLIRHAKTIDDIQGRTQAVDAEIDPGQVAEIEDLKRELSTTAFSHIYVSPQKRARQTADALFGKDVTELPGIFEYVRPRNLNNIPRAQAAEFWDVTHKQDKYDPDWKMNGSESFNDINKRVQDFIAYLATHSNDDVVAVVGHGNFFRHLLGRMLMKEEYSPVIFFDLLVRVEIKNCGYLMIVGNFPDVRLLGIK